MPRRPFTGYFSFVFRSQSRAHAVEQTHANPAPFLCTSGGTARYVELRPLHYRTAPIPACFRGHQVLIPFKTGVHSIYTCVLETTSNRPVFGLEKKNRHGELKKKRLCTVRSLRPAVSQPKTDALELRKPKSPHVHKLGRVHPLREGPQNSNNPSTFWLSTKKKNTAGPVAIPASETWHPF